MRSAGLKILFVATVGLISSAAWAQEQPQQSSFTALLSKDYEVKAVTLVPLEVAKRATASVKTDTVVVTLQNKQSVAVCYIAFANWAFMNRTSLDTPTLCEVREGSAEAANPPPPNPPAAGTTP
jgi:hypothetical protein